MATGALKTPESLTAVLIAPCGMDCGVCLAHLRERKPCPGCAVEDPAKPRHCATCRIAHCDHLAAGGQAFCFACTEYPCARLRRLDVRYRATYGMSMLANLEAIRETGIEAFVGVERERWRCAGCGALVSVHAQDCLHCARPVVREGTSR